MVTIQPWLKYEIIWSIPAIHKLSTITKQMSVIYKPLTYEWLAESLQNMTLYR